MEREKDFNQRVAAEENDGAGADGERKTRRLQKIFRTPKPLNLEDKSYWSYHIIPIDPLTILTNYVDHPERSMADSSES